MPNESHGIITITDVSPESFAAKLAEQEALVADARRWRTLLASGRIRVIGHARLGTDDPHLGLELWGEYPEFESRHEYNTYGAACLTSYVDHTPLPSDA